MMSKKKTSTSMDETTELIDVDSIKSEPEDNSSVSLANPIVIAPETPKSPNNRPFYLFNDRQQVIITPKTTQHKILPRFSTIITLPSSSRNLLSTLSSKQPTPSPTPFPSRPITIPTEIMFSSRSIDADGTVKSLVEYLCNFCQFKSVDKNEHQRHKDTHTFHCHLCSFAAFSRMDVLRHKKQEHPSCREELQGYVELEKLMEDRSFRNQPVAVIKTVNKPLSSLSHITAIQNNNSSVLQHVSTLHNNVHLSTMQNNHANISVSTTNTTNNNHSHTSANDDTASNISPTHNNTQQHTTNSLKSTKSEITSSDTPINTRPKRMVVVNRTPVIDDSDHEINDNVISLIDDAYTNKRSHSNTDSPNTKGREEQMKRRKKTGGENQVGKVTEQEEEQNGEDVLKQMLSSSLPTHPTTQQPFPAAKYVTWSCFYCKFTSAVQQTSLRHVISAHPQQPVQLRRLSYSALPSKTTFRPPSTTQQSLTTTQPSMTTKKSFMEENCLWGCYYCNSQCTNRNNIIQHIKQQHPSSKLVVTRRKMASTPSTTPSKTPQPPPMDPPSSDKTQNKDNVTKNNSFSLQMECSDDSKTDDVAAKMTTPSYRGQSGWACVYCEHQSNNRKQMAIHVMFAHSNDPIRFLNLAPWRQKHKGLHGPRSVRDEMMMRHGNWVWQCPLCTRCHVSKAFILLHIKVAHQDSSNKNDVAPVRISKQHNKNDSSNKEAVLKLFHVSAEDMLDNLTQASFDGCDSFEHDVHRHRRYACGKCGWRGFRTHVVKRHFLRHHPHINISIREHKVAGDKRLRRSKEALMWFACPCCPFISKNKSMLRQHLQQNPDHKLKNKNKKPDNEDEKHDDDDSTAGGASGGGGGVTGLPNGAGGGCNGGGKGVVSNGNDAVSDGCDTANNNKQGDEASTEIKIPVLPSDVSAVASPKIEASNDDDKTAVEANVNASANDTTEVVATGGIDSKEDNNTDYNNQSATTKSESIDIISTQNIKDKKVDAVVNDNLATGNNITPLNCSNTTTMGHLSTVENNVATSDITTGLSLLRKTLSTAPQLFCDMKKINKNDNKSNNNNQLRKNKDANDADVDCKQEATLDNHTTTTTKNLFTHLNTPSINHPSSIHASTYPSTFHSSIHPSTFSSPASNSSPILSATSLPPSSNNCKPGHFKYTVDGKLLKKPNHSSIARAYNNQRYKCPHCSATYGLPQMVKKHMLDEHMKLWQGSVCCVDLRAKQLRKRQKVLFCVEPSCSFYCKQEIEFEGHEKECPLSANADVTNTLLPQEHYNDYDKNNFNDNAGNNNRNKMNGGSKGNEGDMRSRDNILQKSYVCSGCSFKSTNCNAIRQHITDYHDNSIKYSEMCTRLNKDGDIMTCVNDVNVNDIIDERVLSGDSWEARIDKKDHVTFKNHFEGISYNPSDVIDSFLSASNSSTEAITASSETASDKPDDKIYTQL